MNIAYLKYNESPYLNTARKIIDGGENYKSLISCAKYWKLERDFEIISTSSVPDSWMYPYSINIVR